jgi:hypothetical protein
MSAGELRIEQLVAQMGNSEIDEAIAGSTGGPEDLASTERR